MTRMPCALMIVAILLAGAGVAQAQEKVAPVKKAPVTVAVLSFQASDPGNPKLGEQIADAVVAMLHGQPGFTLVDRQSLQRTLAEQELNLTGMVETTQAVKIGKLVGAKILVTGRAFALGKQMFITAKLIGTETTLVDGVLVKSQAEKDVGELVIELAKKISGKLTKAGPKLLAQPVVVADPLPRLKKALAARPLPVVAVIVRERHQAARPAVTRRPADPAVETEIKRLLIACGFTVKDVSANDLADFAKGWTATDVNSWPRGLKGVDVVVAGKSFSEFAMRIGNLVACSSRAEINVISRKTGKIVLADRATTRAADLSEHIAAKTALQKAGRGLGIRVLEHFAKTLPKPRKRAARAGKSAR